MRNLGAHRGLVLILILYTALATSYSVVVPIGRGADEWAHFWYARFIAQNGRLPANPAEREAAGYKSDWPPLYHLFAAGLTAWIETDGPPSFKYRADNIRRRLIPAQGSEAILHTEDEYFPWQQEILVWHLGRFLSIIFTLGSLLLTYFMTLELFSVRQTGARQAGVDSDGSNKLSAAPYTLQFPQRTLGLAAVAVLAFNPRFLFTGMLFSYDSLTLFLSSLFLWLTIRVAKGYYLRWGFVLLGVLAGLALVTKYLAALLPLEIAALGFLLFRNKGRQRSGLKSHLWLKLAQAALAFLLVSGWWFGYLFVNFNEIDSYGPILGTVAPILRGDGSDRTVEALFARLSSGQAPSPAYIEQQSYTAWQIAAELPLTFWGNPISRPYALTWFIVLMSLVTFIAGLGVALFWWGVKGNRFWLNLLLLHCLLAVPFMLVRLPGARDALEAVQGRHILFLAAPAFSILLVLGWWSISHIVANILRIFPYLLYVAPHLSRLMFIVLLGLLSSGALAQLVFMIDSYSTPLPVRTTPYSAVTGPDLPAVVLEGGASLIDYKVTRLEQALQVTLIWQAGYDAAAQDYRMELALVDPQGQSRVTWLAYQTEARYPTRAWEAGDIVRDEGWLPLPGVPAGNYDLRLRILDQQKQVGEWQTVATYSLNEQLPHPGISKSWTLWRFGRAVDHAPIFKERETAQFIFTADRLSGFEPLPGSGASLIGPDDVTRPAASSGLTWANFVIEPDWPAGDYHLAGIPATSAVLRIAESGRNFQTPQNFTPVEANFEGLVKLVGYRLPSPRVEPGSGLPITLYWQGLQWLGEDLVIFDRLLDNQQVAHGGYDRLPREDYSTLLWAPGEIVTDGFAVPVDADAPDGVYGLNIGLYRQIEGQAISLHLIDSESGALTDATAVTIWPLKVGGAPAGVTLSGVTPEYGLEVALGDKVKLLGFDTSDSAFGQGALPADAGSLELALYWQTMALMDTDYTVFAHVRDVEGQTVRQKDGPPANGVYPTSLWDVGEIVRDDISLPVDQLQPGYYQLVVGLYDSTSGLRLPISGSADDTILVRTFEVVQ